ncbi:hypothetical protein QJS10_CPB22g01231 [Acorus calamus]|uniref:Uncharacterized protein n=1 Tax=Acorus calamus TaxID=4465 RepID=A0AAV9BZZ9_ACOCL|nr:hypothetical protein QJS10_CPB22g01231 [Acorus calamus]
MGPAKLIADHLLMEHVKMHKILPGTLTLSPDSCDLIIACTGSGGGVDLIVAESDENHVQCSWEAYGRLDAGRLPERSWW